MPKHSQSTYLRLQGRYDDARTIMQQIDLSKASDKHNGLLRLTWQLLSSSSIHDAATNWQTGFTSHGKVSKYVLDEPPNVLRVTLSPDGLSAVWKTKLSADSFATRR